MKRFLEKLDFAMIFVAAAWAIWKIYADWNAFSAWTWLAIAFVPISIFLYKYRLDELLRSHIIKKSARKHTQMKP
jgi:hypothetical protein